MIQIKLNLADSIHKALEVIVSPLSPEREAKGDVISLNVWITGAINDIVTSYAHKHNVSKAVMIEALLLAFSRVAANGLTKAETASLINEARKVIEQTRPHEKRYKIGLTKATLIPAVLQRIIETSDLDEYCNHFFNSQNK
jgi:hypothetical protein